jgi:hypothetical protein
VFLFLCYIGAHYLLYFYLSLLISSAYLCYIYEENRPIDYPLSDFQYSDDLLLFSVNESSFSFTYLLIFVMLICTGLLLYPKLFTLFASLTLEQIVFLKLSISGLTLTMFLTFIFI